MKQEIRTAVYFWHVELAYLKGLAVCDAEGALVYLSLGLWARLVDLAKRDFRAVRNQYQLVAGQQKHRNAKIHRTLEHVAQMFGDPTKIDRMQTEISYRYIFGTEFQRQVWDRLILIQAGNTSTYGKLAAEMGRNSAARAVGRACGANMLPLLVPCHRVVGSLGSLTGFRWGTNMKRALLVEEGAIAAVKAGKDRLSNNNLNKYDLNKFDSKKATGEA